VKQSTAATGGDETAAALKTVQDAHDPASDTGPGRIFKPSVPGTWSGRDWMLAVLLLAAVGLAYLPVWHAGFIWDDDEHLTQNPCIVGALGLKGIWTTSAATYYPLVLTSFWIGHALWGLNPLPYHLVNVAMHGACAILFVLVLRRLKIKGAWLGVALWALHPVQVESVAWITELKNTQSCLFYLLSILLFLRWRGIEGKRESRYYGLALVCTALAILSKSSTVMLPVILGLCWWWMEGRWRWRNALWLAPFLLIAATASGWTIWEQKYHSRALGPEWSQSWWERIAIAGKSFWFYAGKLAWPHPLIFIYPRWKISIANPLDYLPAVAAASGMYVLWRRRDGGMRALFFAAACYAVSLFPVMGFFNVYFFRYSYAGDHFQYLASMSPLALAGAGAAKVRDSWRRKLSLIQPVVITTVLAALALLTYRQCGMYRDVEALWRTTLDMNPECWLAHNNLGFVLARQGRTEEAIGRYREALRINPEFEEAHVNLGAAYLQQGRTEEAIGCYREALRIKPDFAQAHNNLGNALLQQGRAEEAMGCYREALRIKPAYAEAHYNLGKALLQEGRTEEAIGCYREALRINPDFADAQINLGAAYLQEGRTEEAIGCYREALRINPDFADAQINLGAAYLQEGRTEEAIGCYREALRINPAYAEAHYNLGNALLQEGRTEEAIASYREALRINPAYAEAHNNLGAALLQRGRTDEAIASYREAVRINPAYAEAHNNLGNALLQRGRTEEAIGCYREALRINSTYAEAHYNLCNALLQEGRTKEAIADGEKAIEIQPSNISFQNNLAWILATASEEALRDGARAVQLATQASQASGGGNAVILHSLAAAYAEAGEFPNAVQTARKALQLAEAESNAELANALRREINLYEAGHRFEVLH
jgi:tetratricopeptide (TPR) repeat protein